VSVVDLTPARPELLEQAAILLHDRLPEGWPTVADARAHLRELGDPAHLLRGVVRGGRLLGWLGAQERYPGHVWELHPLVVARDHERRGLGRALVDDLERHVREMGIHTMFVGTDDELAQTSLGGVDLYPDVLAHLARLANLRDHPVGFWQRVGYRVVGVMPDANGFGKPDIYLSKRLLSPTPDTADTA
jgi:aminoglycoside 6'-N-acetyltransferase I